MEKKNNNRCTYVVINVVGEQVSPVVVNSEWLGLWVSRYPGSALCTGIVFCSALVRHQEY